jgi:hypothetical protein
MLHLTQAVQAWGISASVISGAALRALSKRR